MIKKKITKKTVLKKITKKRENTPKIGLAYDDWLIEKLKDHELAVEYLPVEFQHYTLITFLSMAVFALRAALRTISGRAGCM